MSIRHVSDTAATLTSDNPTLADGEWGMESDTGRTKIGDGSSSWTSLGYHESNSIVVAVTDLPVDYSGTPAAAALSSDVVHRAFDAAAAESLAGHISIPDHWNTFNTYIWTVNHAGGGAGNCVLRVYYRFFADGDDDGTATTSVDTGEVTVAVSGTSGLVERTVLGSALTPVLPARLQTVIVERNGAAGADTFASDVGVIAIEIVRAT